jgi:hypothetical protein
MSTPLANRPGLAPHDDPDHTALRDIADSLTAQGFDITGPAWGRMSHAQLTNVRGALCELDLTSGEAMIWEYQPFYGTPTSPEQITGMVMSILGTHTESVAGMPITRYPGSGLKGVVGRALTARGLAARLKVIYQDEANYDVYDVVEVTNPILPGVGKVQVSDAGGIRWECALAARAGATAGLTPADFAQRIATALADRSI